MEITISEQLLWFGASVCMGVAMGGLYCLLSVLYGVLGVEIWTTAVFDVIFFGLCAVASFLFMVIFLDGSVRMYPWVGMAMGGLPVVQLTGSAREKTQRRLRLYRRAKQSGRTGEEFCRFWIKKRKKRKNEQKNL